MAGQSKDPLAAYNWWQNGDKAREDHHIYTDHFIGPVHVRVGTSRQGLANCEYLSGIRRALRILRQHLRYVIQDVSEPRSSKGELVQHLAKAKLQGKTRSRSTSLANP
jgi:hypothetical protein